MVIHEINNINEISLAVLLALKNSKLHKYGDSILIRGSAPGETILIEKKRFFLMCMLN